jgi:Uma2 family endonuclease
MAHLYFRGMALAPSVLVTAQDYRLLPEAGPRYQLIEGELFMSPAPNRFHQKVSGNIYFLLRSYLEKTPAGELYDAPFDLFLGEHAVFQPDILFIANDRRSILTDEGAEGAPNLVIEILSESTAHLDRQTKRKVYAASGVEELWLADPITKTVEVYLLQKNAGQPAMINRDNDVFQSPTFPGLPIALSEIFKE